MPRWEEPAKHYYSPERLAYLREANRKNRARLRNGRPPMTHIERGRLGAAATLAKRRKILERKEIEG